jgi:hypothetical protein
MRIIILFIIFQSTSLLGQDNNALLKFLELAGGKERLMDVSTVAITELTYNINGPRDTIKIYKENFYKAPYRVFLKSRFSSMSKTKVFDGDDFWETGFNGEIRKIEGDELDVMIDRYLNFGIVQILLTAKRYDYLENLEIDNQVYTKCRVTSKTGWRLVCFFNLKTGFLDQYTFNDGANTIKLSDYKEYGGIKFPTRIEGYDGTRLGSITIIKNIVVDNDIPDSMFTKDSLK